MQQYDGRNQMIIKMYSLLWRGHLHLRKGISITVWFVTYTQKTAKESEQQGRARKPLAKVTLNLEAPILTTRVCYLVY